QDLCVDCICPGLDNTTGWFDLAVSFPDPLIGTSNFTAGLLGTIESTGAGSPNIGGIDWLFNEDAFLHTTRLGSQLVTWWSQKNLRNTYIQVTNTIGFCAFNGAIIFAPFINGNESFACYGVQDCEDACDVVNEVLKGDCEGTGDPRLSCVGVPLEVKFLDENCIEITNFCDPYTPGDTHVYNLGDLIDNNGIPRNDAVLQGKEGVFLVTPVNNCEDEFPISWNFLQGNMRLIDQDNDTDYGTNVFARRAIGLTAGCGNDEPGFFIPGAFDCFYEVVSPSQLKHNFFEAGVAAASDLVLISFIDNYFRPPFGPPRPYAVIPGFAQYTPDDFCDEAENCDSCPPFTGCFVRTGLNDPFPISEDFAPPTPTPAPATPTPTPTVTVTPQPCSEDDPVCPPGQFCDIPPGGDTGVCVPATPSPTPGPGGGGNGCDIAGMPVQLGTAMANILIPLVPAFAIGYRIIRRRGRKEGK
ncbi:MAG: hypothetical protein L0Y68_02755, partial [Candidatus Dadabacteria bacterium]|nr:hypothetical protein [Candidatus Dadabacteria bacterium]